MHKMAAWWQPNTSGEDYSLGGPEVLHEKHFYSTSQGTAYSCYGGRSVLSNSVCFVAEPLMVP